MKILQINCVYRKGSTGKITYDIHSQLKNLGYESVVCYGRGKKSTEKGVYKACSELYARVNKIASLCSGIMYGGCYFSTNKLLSIIEKENPDIVHLQCLNGYFVNIYRLISYLKTKNIKTVLTLHAEFMHTANCGYALDCEKWRIGCGSCPRLKKETGSFVFDRTNESWRRMKAAFEGYGDNIIVTSVSPWLRDRAIQSPILSDLNHKVVLNGLDTDIFRLYETEKLRKQLGLENKTVIFHATPKFDDRPDNIKGGRYIIEIAEKVKNGSIRFVIAGTFDPELKVPKNVILLGRVNDQKLLAQYYSMADLTMLTSEKETFSMIVAESLCCGTPVVGFKAGAPEQIALKEYSDFSEYGNTDALIENMMKRIRKGYDANVISQLAKQKYSKKVMFQNYLTIYRGLIDESDN